MTKTILRKAVATTAPRNRVTVDCSRPELTEQEHANSCNINFIVAQFEKTGELPQSVRIPKFQDNTETPTLEEAFNVARDATNAFLDLPATLRRQMDNNPENLESFILDPDNYDTLKKHGVIIETQIPNPNYVPPAKDPSEKTE